MDKVEVISETTHTATKTIDCDACKWLQTANQQELMSRMTTREQNLVRRVVNIHKFKIRKGMRYMKHVVKYNDVEHTSYFLVKIHDICVKYKIYSYLREDSEQVKVSPEGRIIQMNDQSKKQNLN